MNRTVEIPQSLCIASFELANRNPQQMLQSFRLNPVVVLGSRLVPVSLGNLSSIVTVTVIYDVLPSHHDQSLSTEI